MLYKYLPNWLFRRLFGDRRKFGTTTMVDDQDYRLWQTHMETFYKDCQKGPIGHWVNDMGFCTIGEVDLAGKTVLEIGPGIIEHTRHWRGLPSRYLLVDVLERFLVLSSEIIQAKGVSDVEPILSDGETISCEDNSIDIIVTFHQLEHVQNLEAYLNEIFRILKPGGLLVGAVPCEGGLAWGFGRFMTSRRYVKRSMPFNYDKIICWEHPQFVHSIKNNLDKIFRLQKSFKRPFGILPFDFNLSWSFIYKKDKP